MSVAAWALQTAVYARLNGDATLMGLVSGVYDEVPAAVGMPYLTLGETVEIPDDAHDRQGLESTLTLHIWSRYRGFAEAVEVLAACDRLLDRAPLTVDGFTDVSVAHEWHQTMRDPDPDVRHLPVRYRVWLTER